MNYLMGPYDSALERILKQGSQKPDRTGVGSYSIFGMQCRYRLDDRFPLLTRRKTYPNAIFAELLWFLSGSTNVHDLQRLGSRIWDPWIDVKFEQRHRLLPGDLGAVYGFQLRHFGAAYGSNSVERARDGFDQLAYIVRELKKNKYSRRIMFDLWNPKQLDIQRLPPCHFHFQLLVDEEDRLTGILTQRSADFPLGVPANIQFYAALTLMLAQQADLKPHELVHNTNDSHIYMNQTEAVEEYLASPVVESPFLEIRKAPDILEYKLEDFVLRYYNPGKRIDIPVTV